MVAEEIDMAVQSLVLGLWCSAAKEIPVERQSEAPYGSDPDPLDHNGPRTARAMKRVGRYSF